jgi:hypothetical protein
MISYARYFWRILEIRIYFTEAKFFVPARLGEIVGYAIGTSVRMPPAVRFLHRFTGDSNISLAIQRSKNDCVSIAQQIRETLAVGSPRKRWD